MAKSSTFFPAPSQFSPVICVQLYGKTQFGDGWRALREEIAEQLNCSEDSLSIEDIEWEDGKIGERWADFVTLDGRVIGSLDEHLTADEWRDFFATRVTDSESLRKDIIATARARAALAAQ